MMAPPTTAAEGKRNAGSSAGHGAELRHDAPPLSLLECRSSTEKDPVHR